MLEKNNDKLIIFLGKGSLTLIILFLVLLMLKLMLNKVKLAM